MKILLLFLFLISSCSSFEKGSKDIEVIAVCYQENFFTKICKYVEKTYSGKTIDLVSLSQNSKPNRPKSGFIKFDFFSKINFQEAKTQAIQMCDEAFRNLDYFEITYKKKFGIETEGVADIWCSIEENKDRKKVSEVANKDLTTQ